MTKEFKNLQSEQLPNDGSWHWSKLVNEANDRLNKIGKHGKRAKIKVTPKPGKPISAQFSLPEIGQKSYGLNLQLNQKNLIKAEETCSLITGQLVAGTFTMDWFYSIVGKSKKVTKPEKPLTCGEMLKQYKTHYLRQKKDKKSPDRNWKKSYKHIEKTFLKNKDSVISLKIIKETIECTENNTPSRTTYLNGLANLLKHFDNNEFKQVIKRYKTENNPKPQKKYIPTDSEIMYVYQTEFEPKPNCPKKYRYRYAQWQFLYTLLATYGLRIHEAWNIKNWDKPVYLKAGDWVVIADDSEDINNEGEDGKYTYQQIKQDEVIPAILDPDNKDYLLCIGHETKTGYRVAFPMSPNGIGRDCNWIQQFNLIQSMNLPDIKEPLKEASNGNRNCTNITTQWFNPPGNYKKNKHNNALDNSTLRYGFTAHALRHAYNIRGHKLGVTQKMLADSLGHGLQMNSNNYLKHEQTSSKIQGIKREISNQIQAKSKLQELEQENKYFKAENKHLKAENEKLRTKLAMYEAIEQARKNN